MPYIVLAAFMLFSHHVLARDVTVTAHLERVAVKSNEQSSENMKLIRDAAAVTLKEHANKMCGALAEPLAEPTIISAEIHGIRLGQSAINLGYVATAQVAGTFRCLLPADGVLIGQSGKEFIYASQDERRNGFDAAVRELQEEALANVCITGLPSWVTANDFLVAHLNLIGQIALLA